MRILFIATFLLVSISVLGQRYRLISSEVSFFSEAPLEDIEAKNSSVLGLFDSKENTIALSIPMNKFIFPNSLMQEHFNEKYLETDKYPRATFKGKLSSSVNQTVQELTAVGLIEIHGVEKEYSTTGKVEKKGNTYQMNAEFMVVLKDHKIKIPKLMWQNIAEEIKVSVLLVFEPDE